MLAPCASIGNPEVPAFCRAVQLVVHQPERKGVLKSCQYPLRVPDGGPKRIAAAGLIRMKSVVSAAACVHYRVSKSLLSSGFTLVELLVVLAVIALLAALLLPALSRAKEQAYLTVCRNNMRQIGFAFRMYLDDNSDAFPAAAFIGTVMPEDWIYWDPDNGGIIAEEQRPRDITRSPIAFYLAKFNTNLFRCPSDRTLKKLDENSPQLDFTIREFQRFRFSYTLSSSLPLSQQVASGVPISRSQEFKQRGMASVVYRRDWNPILFHSAEIRDPSAKIMLAEEKMLYEMGTTFHGDAYIAYGSGWEWPRDQLTERHNKKGNVALADGHVETVKPAFGRQKEHYDPLE